MITQEIRLLFVILRSQSFLPSFKEQARSKCELRSKLLNECYEKNVELFWDLKFFAKNYVRNGQTYET